MNIQPIRIYSDEESKNLTKNDDEVVLPQQPQQPQQQPQPEELCAPDPVFDVDINDEVIEQPCTTKKNNLFGVYKINVDEKNKSTSIPFVYIGMALGLLRFIA